MKADKPVKIQNIEKEEAPQNELYDRRCREEVRKRKRINHFL